MLLATSAFSGTFPNLKEMLEQDWGYELSLIPGSNGDGGKLSPIIVNSSDPTEIKLTTFFTVQGLHRGMSETYKTEEKLPTGVIWKVTDGLKYDEVSSLYFLRVKRKILTKQEKITETARFYFDIPKLQEPISDQLKLPYSFEENRIGVKLPFEIGYLQNRPNQTIDYGQKYNRPDLGYGLAFDAIGIKATVYFYPTKSKISPLALKNEFEKASQDIINVSEQKLTAWPDANIEGVLYRRYWAVDPGSAKATALWLFTYNGQFVKIRMTWNRDETIDELANEFAATLTMELLRK